MRREKRSVDFGAATTANIVASMRKIQFKKKII